MTALREPRRLLVEYSAKDAATTLGAIVARRVDLEQRLAGCCERGAVEAHYAESLRRELRDTEEAERVLRAALGTPWTDEWGGILQYQTEDR